MSALDIDTSDLEGLFKLLDIDGDEKVTAAEFLESATRLKGTAKGIDMLSVLTHLRKLSIRVDYLLEMNGHFKYSRSATPCSPKTPTKSSSHKALSEDKRFFGPEHVQALTRGSVLG